MAVTGLHPWKKAIITYGQKEKETPCDLIGLVSQYQPMDTPNSCKAKSNQIYELCFFAF